MFFNTFLPLVLNAKEKNELTLQVILIATGLILPLALIIISYSIYRTSRWKKGKFPTHIKFNEENLLEAYISLSALTFRKNIQEKGDKIKFMNNYFRTEFPNSNYNFIDSLNFAFEHPIQLDSICYWINTHLIEKTHRVQILYFLVGIAIQDGHITPGEKELFDELAPHLNLEVSDLESIISMYEQREERKRKYEQEPKQKSQVSRRTQREIYLGILGLTKETDQQIIKKTYRKLVMIHHPDKFVNESEDHQIIAKNRFLMIQEAYDFLYDDGKPS